MYCKCGVLRGGDGIRTRVDGFAGRCLASRPRHHCGFPTCVTETGLLGFTRADDEIRTRDPHLGKVMRYHCATSAFLSPHFCDVQNSNRWISGSPNRRNPGVFDPPPDPMRFTPKRRGRRSMCIAPSGSASIGNRDHHTGESTGRLAQLVARFLHTEEVTGSIPVSPTK